MNTINNKGSEIAMIAGVLLLFSGTVSGDPFTGVATILSALFYKGQKINLYSKNTKWKVTSYVALVLLILQTLSGFLLSNTAIVHPLGFIIVPLWLIVAYATMMSKKFKVVVV